MKVELVAVGSELLLGQSTDTNSVWISEQLSLSGINCFHHSTVGDNLDRISSVLEAALLRSDVVICTGGLGPTQDDITREAIANVAGVCLVTNDDLVNVITEKFASRNRDMAQNNLLQAMLPEGASALASMPGTAPGLKCVIGEKIIYAFPGVPYEMKEMFSNDVLPELIKLNGGSSVIRSRLLRTWGMSESGLAELLDPHIKRLDSQQPKDSHATLAFLASGVEGLKVRVTAKAETEEVAVARLDLEESKLREYIDEIIFGTDSENMESVVIELLKESNNTLSVAESLTGGYIAGRICAVPGASQVFKGGVVAYQNSLKHDVLAVTEEKVITEKTALQMAAGVRKLTGSTIALATTGVAGPQEVENQPVGTVCIAISSESADWSQTVYMPKTREQVRALSTITALNELRKFILAIL